MLGMILLVFSALLFLPSNLGHLNSHSPHNSDALRVKCEALPYRTAYIGNRCYFSVAQEVKLSEATAHCKAIFPGAQVATDVSTKIFNAMMLEKSKFHANSSKATEEKQSICSIDSGYKCGQNSEQSPIFPGKCIASNEILKNFAQATLYCNRLDMSVPVIGNEKENRMIIDAIPSKGYAWLRDKLSYGKWTREKYYLKYDNCNRPNVMYAGGEVRSLCPYDSASVLDKKIGYWGVSTSAANRNMGTGATFGAVCVADAQNEFTPGRRRCIEHHEWDEETGLCEWTGPKDACLQVVDYSNKTLFVDIKDFPRQTHSETTFVGGPLGHLNDIIIKAIVRRGCMFTGYAANVHEARRQNEVMEGNGNKGYGVWGVPCYYTGDLRESDDGLSRIACFCDPTEATLNNHVYEPPKKQKCIEHHVFNETTQTCEWQHDPKFCGELITYDGRRQMIEIPNWPSNKKYDVDHWVKKRGEDFHVKITEVIVRQHCWVSLFQWALDGFVTLPPTSYGKHQVLSHYNGKLGTEQDGTHRVICDCLH